ncbi:MAG: AAA family ATPase, partial [Candidatus Eisenbacteria bacterium]|nr:AAA family ATPase [Candidatus Eisenbacteria bacterium]
MNQHTPGLSFKKLDLHIHTPASKCFLATQVTPSQIVQSALDAGLAGIAVTDHNSAAWIERVQLAAKQHLVVFPGVEITCMGGITGIHIIALFDPACKQAHVEGLLASLGLRPEDHGKIETVVQKSPSDVIDAIVSKGGLPVLAHANSSNGAFCDMKGQQRIKLIRHPRLCAVEARDFANKELAARNKRVIDLLDGADPEYETHLAVYQASDNPAAEGSGKHGLAGIGSRCAYFKMDAVTLAGLEQAFNDPIVRIRQDFEYKTYEYPRISRLRVVGAFLDGLDVQLHDGLTSILGAKGSGKSLLVEFLRFVLDQPSSNTGIRQDHEAKLEARLEEFGTVAVDFRDETGRELSVRRTYGSGDMGGYDEDSPEEVARLFPVLFLSQNEIIRIAENEEEQIQFIDRFFDFRTYISEIATLEGGLGREDRALAESLRSYTAVQELEQALKLQKRETLKLDSALKNEVFENFRLAEIKRRAFQEQISFIENRIEILESLGREVLSNDDPLLPDSVETDPALKRTHAILKTGRASLKEKD